LDLRRLWPIFLIIFTNILGAGVILPILPLYAEGEFAGTVFQITLLSASFFGAQFLAAPILGRLSDRYGRRPLLMVSQTGTVLAFILFIFAAPLGRAIDGLSLGLPLTGGMIMLFVARILDGITGGNITIAQAYVTDVTSDEDRAQGLGYLQGAFGMGFIFGPAFGGILRSYGSVAPFVGAAIITTGTLLLTTFLLRESLPEEERSDGRTRRALIPSPRVLIDQPLLALILSLGFTASLAFSSLPSTFALYADRVLFSERLSPDRVQLFIGFMLTFMGFVMVITQVFLLRPLVERLGERRLLILGELALMTAFYGLGFASGPLAGGALLAPFAFGQGITEPNLQSLVSRLGSRSERGQLLGFYQASRSLALIGGPIMAGIIFETVSGRAVYWAGGGLVTVALILAFVLLRQPVPAGPRRVDGRETTGESSRKTPEAA
jgi:DHA1 family tetracycline resistance protein-like MFS transporter